MSSLALVVGKPWSLHLLMLLIVPALVKELAGKNLEEVIAAGTEKLVSSGVGAAAAATPAAGGAAPAAAPLPQEESEEEDDEGFGL